MEWGIVRFWFGDLDPLLLARPVLLWNLHMRA